MLKRLLLTTALLGAGPAFAADTAIIMWNSANPGGAVTATGIGTVDLGTENLNGISVFDTSVQKTTGPNSLSEQNLIITNTNATAQTLVIIAGANGFTPGATSFSLTGTIDVDSVSGLASQADLMGSFFTNAANVLNGQTTSVAGLDIADFDSGLLTAPHSFSFNGSALDSIGAPYGMAEELTLTLAPGAQVGVQGLDMTANVPEPRTWALMGIGFALMAFLGLRKRKTARFAAI